MTGISKRHGGITYWTKDRRRFTNHQENIFNHSYEIPLAEIVQRASEIDWLDQAMVTREDDYDYSVFYLTGFRWVTDEENARITAAIAKEKEDLKIHKEAKAQKEREEYERLKAIFEKEEQK